MRGLSEQVVLEAILAAGPITRPEIAHRTKLSKPTVSEAVRSLMQERLIRSAGLRPGSRGRSPVSYVVDDAAGHVIGVDIGGSYVRLGAANLFGELLSKRREPQTSSDPAELAKQVGTMVAEMVRATSATHSQVLAVAVSFPHSWHRGPAATSLVEMLRERVGVPVISDSQLNLNALGEKWRGFGAGISDFVFLSVGAEVGAGIVVGDELVRGHRLTAGNIEVMLDLPLRDATVPRPLGGGMSADALLLQARQLQWREGVPTTIEDVFARVDSEPSARRLLSTEARRVAFVGAAICALLDPELLVLGGGIGSHPELHAEVQELLGGMLSEPPRLETSLLRDEAALFGAIATGLRAAHDRLVGREVPV
jgi:predicted NBD/HSP70 family sugar kinase